MRGLCHTGLPCMKLPQHIDFLVKSPSLHISKTAINSIAHWDLSTSFSTKERFPKPGYIDSCSNMTFAYMCCPNKALRDQFICCCCALCADPHVSGPIRSSRGILHSSSLWGKWLPQSRSFARISWSLPSPRGLLLLRMLGVDRPSSGSSGLRLWRFVDPNSRWTTTLLMGSPTVVNGNCGTDQSLLVKFSCKCLTLCDIWWNENSRAIMIYGRSWTRSETYRHLWMKRL